LNTITGFLGSGFVDGASNVARFEVPYDVISDTSGNLLVADGGNHSIRKITDGFTTTLAGNGVVGNQDGDGAAARFNFPTGIIRISDTEYWIFDFNNDRIRKLEID
jgi:hypothetical protein